jgi:signal peptidase I
MRGPWINKAVTAVGVLAVVLLFALVLTRIFFYQPFNAPSASMEPTIAVGDYIILSKRAYTSRAPGRGDVVVFKMPNPSSPDYGRDYVKRIVGLPGDRLQMINSQLVINGVTLPRRRIADYVEEVDGVAHHVLQYEETLPGGREDVILDRQPDGELDNTGVYVVPPSCYFVLGDNRDNSDDSRDHVGYVPADAIRGRVIVKFVSGGSLTWKAIN